MKWEVQLKYNYLIRCPVFPMKLADLVYFESAFPSPFSH